jgi:predicted AAA+ superfamily ATPase
MEIWWIPFVYKLDDEEIIRDFVKWIIDTIFIKDLVPRYNIKDVFLLKELFIFLLNNVWNLTNITNIVNYLKSVRIHTNYNTIASYIEVLKSAYLVYEANLLDLKWKRIFNRERKFYIWDHIFQKVFLSSTVLGIWKTLENIVYIMALRKGYNVFVWRLNNQEIDFVLEKNGKKIYLQVVYILVDEDVVKREFWNFDKIQDNWEKFVVSMDEVNFWVINWIKHIKVWELDEYI